KITNFADGDTFSVGGGGGVLTLVGFTRPDTTAVTVTCQVTSIDGAPLAGPTNAHGVPGHDSDWSVGFAGLVASAAPVLLEAWSGAAGAPRDVVRITITA